MDLVRAVPVLEVVDVASSVAWYRDTLGFSASPFPESPPYAFAILERGGAEIMLRHGERPSGREPRPYRWDVYLRLSGGRLREIHARLSERGAVTRRLERMFYGLAEFEVADPDGHVVCLSEELADVADLPTPEV